MANFTVNVEWKMYGQMGFEADSKEEAIEKAMAASLPDGGYVSDSFAVTSFDDEAE